MPEHPCAQLGACSLSLGFAPKGESVHSGSCMHPVLSRSVVGDSSPCRVVAQGDGWGWMRPERYSQCLRSPCPPQPTWVLLCKSSLAEDRISAIVCAHWSVADKMKLCLPDPNRD